ncbi:MAG TPA: hypothetical protein VGZ22_16000 [Isosphaeraceae bacterium]|jgi:hypothetical protein|nr:hypothetical protein [Isosphaeraceae bacterium]
MIDEHDHSEDHDHGDSDESFELELNTQSQIFLDMRQQNLDLLEIASRVAGYGGEHGPVKPGDIRQVMKSIWEIYSEFYQWIDPEEPGDDEEDSEA